MFTINLNLESASVLLRCLNYGQAATSQQEAKNGVEAVVKSNIEYLRQQVTRGVSKEVINRASLHI